MDYKGCTKKTQTLDFFIHKSRNFKYFFMKINMGAPNYITKLFLNWFESMSFHFGIRANLPGVGAGQALRGKGSWHTTCRKTRFVST